MRIGLFGGTFDPIHIGHLRAAAEVKQGFDLDRIVFIPAALPPHKTRATVTDAADRLKMVELAVSGLSGFEVSDVELKRAGPSYSIDTIDHFKRIAPGGSGLFFITGLDAFLEIDTWKSYSDLLERVAFIVIARPLVDGSGAESRWIRLEKFIKSKISDAYEITDAPARFVHSEAKPIYIFDVTALDISSTRIRELIRKDQSVKFLLPAEIENYIYSRGLYL
jgi:nicotinate-nucleotide adenylyltransferase